ncbi:MAG: cytochrome b561 [Alphaproteobacteria bacterium]|nr:MAG: cytochrome b561 [Alphaproteobacteria bacterium]
MNFLKRTYNWTLEKAQHKNAKWYLSLISFAESSFFPIPPDILLIPMALASKAKALFYAFICTLFSVLGGILGYAIGYYFYNSVGIYIVDFYHLENSFNIFESYYKEFGILIVLGAGITPFPYKFITIASGVFGLNIFLFIIVSIIGRGLRFYLIAILLYFFGEKIKLIIDKYFNVLTIVFFILLVGSVFIIRFL